MFASDYSISCGLNDKSLCEWKNLFVGCTIVCVCLCVSIHTAAKINTSESKIHPHGKQFHFISIWMVIVLNETRTVKTKMKWNVMVMHLSSWICDSDRSQKLWYRVLFVRSFSIWQSGENHSPFILTGQFNNMSDNLDEMYTLSKLSHR